ncbi:MAG: Gfo/Idh/MocA family oxidoreductase, partial [Bacillaceae bacterium]
MRTIKTAIVGTGFSATSHLEALRRVPNVEVTAIVSQSLSSAKGLAEKFGVAYAYDDVEEMLKNEEIEVVHNCTPNSLHFPINKRALESGKHVLSEKPLAITSEETRQLHEIALENNRIHGVCFNYRFYPLVQEVKSRLKGEKQVYLVHGGYVQDWLLYPTDYSWRLDKRLNGPSRAIADIGSHWCET